MGGELDRPDRVPGRVAGIRPTKEGAETPELEPSSGAPPVGKLKHPRARGHNSNGPARPLD